MAFTLNSKSDDAVKCRIFIGNLPNESVSKESLRQVFSQFGTFLDCSIYKNFGFVQFADEKSAIDAVAGTNHTMMFDRRLDVKIATNKARELSAAKKKKFEADGNVRPLMARTVPEPNNYPQQYPQPAMTPQQPPVIQNPYNFPPLYSSQGNPQQIPNFSAYHQAQLATHMQSSQTSHQQSSQQSLTNLPPVSAIPHKEQSNTDKLLCDIICANKKLYSYAEFIEYTLAKIGLTCNINILCNNYPSDFVIKRLARDSITCAVVLKDDNEAHHSISLHTFGQNPEEHRNMPVDVAETFLKKKLCPVQQNEPQSSSNRSFNYSIQASNPQSQSNVAMNKSMSSNQISNNPVYPEQYYPSYRGSEYETGSYYPQNSHFNPAQNISSFNSAPYPPNSFKRPA